MVYMYGYLYDLQGTGAQTIAKIPKKDWCRVVFVVNESNVNTISFKISYDFSLYYSGICT